MLILNITLIAFGVSVLFIGWGMISHSPVVDDDGHQRAAEREERWYPMKPNRQQLSLSLKRK